MTDKAQEWARERANIGPNPNWTTDDIEAAFRAGQAEAEARVKALIALITDEDAIADAISDSLEMDWTSADGARAVVAMFCTALESHPHD